MMQVSATRPWRKCHLERTSSRSWNSSTTRGESHPSWQASPRGDPDGSSEKRWRSVCERVAAASLSPSRSVPSGFSEAEKAMDPLRVGGGRRQPKCVAPSPQLPSIPEGSVTSCMPTSMTQGLKRPMVRLPCLDELLPALMALPLL